MKLTVRVRVPSEEYQEMRTMIFHPKTATLNLNREVLTMKLWGDEITPYKYKFDTVQTIIISNLDSDSEEENK